MDSEEGIRYVVRMEVYAAIEPDDDEIGDERDHLQEIDDILERLDSLESDELSGDVYQQVRYDLCSDCREKFLQNPLGRLAATNIGFSEN